MIRTSVVISDLSSVPREWVFEKYLDLPEKLQGQEVSMKSIWNPGESNPSLTVYVAKGSQIYRFKDFSSGKGGDGIELVMQIFGLSSRSEAARKIMVDYQKYVLSNSVEPKREYKEHHKYKLHSFQDRSWSTIDQAYWTKFRIGSDLLGKYCVRPLEEFMLKKQNDQGGYDELVVRGNKLYGYFRLDGSIYKIYQPDNRERKFFKVESYIQGSEQLNYSQPCLIITKALKDIMCLTRMDLEAESVAPDSENAILPNFVVQSYLNRYKKVFTLFDNDAAGIKAMTRYQEQYGITPLHLKAEKDPSDSVKVHGLQRTGEWIRKLMHE